MTLYLSLAIFIALNIHFWRTGLLSMFHPFTYYSALHGLVFVIRPLIAYYGQYDKIYAVYQFLPSLGERITVIAAANLGLLVFFYFCTSVGSMPMVFKHDGSRLQERAAVRRVLPIMVAICGSVGLYSLITNITTAVDDSSTMITSAQGIRINTTGNGYLTDAMMMLVSVCALVPWFYRFRWYSLLPLAAFFVLKASTGGRGPFVIAVTVAGLLYCYDKRIKVPGLSVALGIAAVGMVFAAIGADRGYALREALGFENRGTRSLATEQRFLEGMDFANKEYFEYVVHVVPERSGTYDYFLANLQVFTGPIPRVLWKDKPIGPPITLINFFEYGTPVGFTMTVPGIGWYELGWLGVAIWCAIWGAGTGWLYRRFVTGSQDAIAVSMYIVFLGSLIIAYRDGATVSVLRMVMFYLGPVALLAGVRKAFSIPSLAQMQKRLLAMRPGPLNSRGSVAAT
jgi:hypothetical protein